MHKETSGSGQVILQDLLRSHRHVPTFHRTLAGTCTIKKILRTKTHSQNIHQGVAPIVTTSTQTRNSCKINATTDKQAYMQNKCNITHNKSSI
jgi:hypothetical protein